MRTKSIAGLYTKICIAILMCSCTHETHLVEYSEDGKFVKSKFDIIAINDSTYVKHGLCQIYYEDKKLHIVGQYRNGLKHGKEIFYDMAGRKSSETQYLDGKEVGVSRMWYQGKLMFEVQMSNGVKNGFYRHWDSEGILVEEKAYTNDSANGWFSTWDGNGKLLTRYKYKMGNMTESIVWDDDGNKQHTIYDSIDDTIDYTQIKALLFDHPDRTQYDSAIASGRKAEYFKPKY